MKKILLNLLGSAIIGAGGYVTTQGTPTTGGQWGALGLAALLAALVNQGGLHQEPPTMDPSGGK